MDNVVDLARVRWEMSSKKQDAVARADRGVQASIVCAAIQIKQVREMLHLLDYRLEQAEEKPCTALNIAPECLKDKLGQIILCLVNIAGDLQLLLETTAPPNTKEG